ncbi:MAG: carboxylate--amine ligase, partial [Chloroflexi bacterium]
MPIEFASSPRPTLGVEVELELVDRETRELVSGAHEILTEIAQALPDGEPGKAKAELLQSTIEIITGICHTVREAKHDLAASLDDLRPYTDRDGLLLMCSGTHPFSDPATQVISPDPRYQRLVDEMQWPARQMQIFGIHVHV